MQRFIRVQSLGNMEQTGDLPLVLGQHIGKSFWGVPHHLAFSTDPQPSEHWRGLLKEILY